MITTIKATRQTVWNLIENGQWTTFSQAKAAVAAYEHLDKALGLGDGGAWRRWPYRRRTSLQRAYRRRC